MANGAYQAPYGIDIGLSYLIRQGYPMPWYRQTRGIADPNSSTKNVLYVPDFGRIASRPSARWTCASASRSASGRSG